MIGWTALWETYRACLENQDIDITIPDRLPDLLAATAAYENIVAQVGNIPVGFWPQGELIILQCFEIYSIDSLLLWLLDPSLLTVGQLQWMDYELFLPALRPLFLSNGLPPSLVDRLIKEAQQDLYYPTFSPYTTLHIAYASKCFATSSNVFSHTGNDAH
jgi:hypothetical protein